MVEDLWMMQHMSLLQMIDHPTYIFVCVRNSRTVLNPSDIQEAQGIAQGRQSLGGTACFILS